MNHIYKVIWHKTKQCYTVASELAAGNAKGSSGQGKDQDGKKLAVLAALLLTVGTGAATVYADTADIIKSNSATPIPAMIGNNQDTLSVGWQSAAWGNNATALGVDAKTLYDYATATGSQSFAVEQSSAYGAQASASGSSSAAFGFSSKASGWSASAYGTAAQATNMGASSFGAGASSTGLESTAVGTDSIANGEYSTAVGSYSHAEEKSSAFGTNSIAENGGSAFGEEAQATGLSAIAVGISSQASGQGAAAVGAGSQATGAEAMAIGVDAQATNDQSVALGSNSKTGDVHTGDTAKQVSFDGGKTTQQFAGIASADNGTVSVGSVGKERQIQNVAAGDITASSTDAVNGSQLYATNQQVQQGWNAQIDGTTVNNVTPSNKNMNFVTGDNIVLSNSNSGIKISTSKNISVDTVKVGDTVNISNSGIDAGGTKVTNMAAGDVTSSSTDAVNGSQLYAVEQKIDTTYGDTITKIGNSINQLGDRVNKVGAGAAALAALHPLDFDPDDKWDFAAGYGHYKSEGAAAIGAFYRPNEDTMLSLGASLGNGESMWNTGLSVKLGQGNHVSTSRVAMAKEMLDLRADNKAMHEQINTLNSRLNSVLGMLDMAKSASFPDVPENHWAYEAVAKLAGNGVIKGYPDGTFQGDRAMTRYEFASMLYRAMEKGATVDGKLLKEFQPELNRIRVDTVSKNPKIQRVRVIHGRG